MIEKDTTIDTTEEVSLVTQDGPVWSELIQIPKAVFHLSHVNGYKLRVHQDQFQEQLQTIIGMFKINDNKETLLLLLCLKHKVQICTI